jgi:hypothetical protein
MTTKYTLPLLYDYVFANTILPNALTTELGIVTYLHTLHSNRLTHNSLFEEDLSEKGPMRLIFGKSLGNYPTSLRHNGSHLTAGPFWEYLEIVEDSLYFGKRKFPKYIYSIKITPHLDEFFGFSNNPIGNKLNGEYFWKNMSAESLQDARQGRAIILIDYVQENYVEKWQFDFFHETLKWSGIPPENIIFMLNSFNAQEVYERWYTTSGSRRMQVRNFPFVMCNSSWNYNHPEHHQTMDENEFLTLQDIIRPNHFLFKIHRARQHRLALLYRLATNNLLEKADWSCLDVISYDENRVRAVANQYRFDVDLNKIEELHTKIPHNLQSEQGYTYDQVCAWNDKHSNPHQQSYLYVCSETYTHGEFKSLTEKVFKPIANFQPFIFVAYPGALQLLRDLGFKTFTGFINEDYDNEPDEVLRMHMIYSEITRISSMSTEEIHNWFWSMKDILIHNNRHVLEIYKNEARCVELVKYLHERLTT